MEGLWQLFGVLNKETPLLQGVKGRLDKAGRDHQEAAPWWILWDLVQKAVLQVAAQLCSTVQVSTAFAVVVST